jgi:hypothetical protein
MVEVSVLALSVLAMVVDCDGVFAVWSVDPG